MIRYKGYIGHFSFDEKVMLFRGSVTNVRHIITFESKFLSKVRQTFREVVDKYILWCTAHGKHPEEPLLEKNRQFWRSPGNDSGSTQVAGSLSINLR